MNSERTQGEKYAGLYVIGIDFGKHADHSAIAVLQRSEDELRLVYLKEFPLDTPNTAVRRLNEAYRFSAKYLDQTEVGEGPYEEIKQFMPAIKGVTLTAQMKENIMGRLRLALEQHQLVLPRDSERLLIQISAQQCEPSKSGTLKFTHPTGTHDDQLWSLALAVYAGHEPPFPRLTRPHAKWVE